ncbi:MAG: ribonuclease HII [Desulfuromonas sp.]|nr:MAG: ribonuclease HII [Desulfuromonas sp.]
MTEPLFPLEDFNPLVFEQRAWASGYRFVAGIDEAGRGPLAGPVVAAAVILPETFDLTGLTDSKKLSEKAREKLYPLIRQQAVAVGIALATPCEIDQHNILQATLLSMQKAVARLPIAADCLLIDGISPIPSALPQKTIKKGDSLSLSIAAASVVAKVVRDRIMIAYDRHYPGFGFSKHKGYGSKEHRQAIEQLGPTPIHRKSFRCVREFVEGK